MDDDTGKAAASMVQRRYEDVQRLALAAACAGAWEWEVATGTQIWSPETFDLFGLAPEDGPPDWEDWLARCVHPDDRHLFKAELARLSAPGGGQLDIEFRVSAAERGSRWMRSTGRLICDGSGRPLRACGLVASVPPRHQLEARLREKEERLRLAMAAGRIGVWDWDVVADRVTWSDTHAPATAALGTVPQTVEDWLAQVHPDDRPRVRQALDQALAGEADYDIETRMLAPGGRVFRIVSRGAVSRDSRGRPLRMIGIDRDVTEERETDEKLRRLACELDHRTKNVFAVVQAIVSQTLRPGPERQTLLHRLSALTRAHDLARDGHPRKLGALVRAALAPYPPERISLAGPTLALTPQATSALALVLHELATNAAKHGGLSDRGGRISVAWTVDRSAVPVPLLSLRWSETCEFRVSPPSRKGFGSLVIEQSVARSLGGRTTLEFAATGLSAVLTMPLDRLKAAAPRLPGRVLHAALMMENDVAP